MRRINYNGLIVYVREKDLEAGIAYLSQCKLGERQQILRNVEKALDHVLRLPANKRDELSKQQLQNIANDIGIWLAGEILAGRAEHYKMTVQ